MSARRPRLLAEPRAYHRETGGSDLDSEFCEFHSLCPPLVPPRTSARGRRSGTIDPQLLSRSFDLLGAKTGTCGASRTPTVTAPRTGPLGSAATSEDPTWPHGTRRTP
eukprot:scaffold133306_cov98-Phaeocystis_antarctica.AAC.1